MGVIQDLLVGKSENTSQSGKQFQSQHPYINPRERMPFDLLNRGIIGQLAQPPQTAISVPQQQGISNLQAGLPATMANFGIGSSLAERLGGRPITPVQTSMGTAQPGAMLPGGAGGGAPQFGLQSRQQLGIPDRESYFPFTPSAADVEALGLPSVRSGEPAVQKLDRKTTKLENRIEKRQAAGKGTAKAEGKLAAIQARRDRKVNG